MSFKSSSTTTSHYSERDYLDIIDFIENTIEAQEVARQSEISFADEFLDKEFEEEIKSSEIKCLTPTTDIG